MQKIVQKVAAKFGLPVEMSPRTAVEVLQAVTSFEFFDQLAGERRPPAEVLPVVQKLAVKWLGLDGVKI